MTKSLLKALLTNLLVVSLGLILVLTFFRPWMPDEILSWGVCLLIAHEPNTGIRLMEGIAGIIIMGFGIFRLTEIAKENPIEQGKQEISGSVYFVWNGQYLPF